MLVPGLEMLCLLFISNRNLDVDDRMFCYQMSLMSPFRKFHIIEKCNSVILLCSNNTLTVSGT